MGGEGIWADGKGEMGKGTIVRTEREGGEGVTSSITKCI